MLTHPVSLREVDSRGIVTAPARMDLLIDTLTLRPYVFAFMAAFLVLALHDLGRRRTVAFTASTLGVAWTAEFVSTRVGFPFGLYCGLPVVVASAVFMMLLDVVIDPLAVRGDRWFLGRVFYYPDGGVLFGVPLSNFAGWVLVGGLAIGAFVGVAGGGDGDTRSARGGVVLYYGVLAFNLALAWWIGERVLFGLGVLLHLSL